MAGAGETAGTGGRAALARRVAVVALVILALDRATKLWVIEGLGLPAIGRMEVWDPYLNLVMAWNRGINFGIGASGPEAMRWVLTALAAGISAALVWWTLARAKAEIALGTGLVVGGAIGNAWDRVQYGAVADFLNMSCCGIQNPYAFNVADVAIFAGAVSIALRA